MNGMEISSAVRYKLNLIVIVLNNVEDMAQNDSYYTDLSMTCNHGNKNIPELVGGRRFCYCY